MGNQLEHTDGEGTVNIHQINSFNKLSVSISRRGIVLAACLFMLFGILDFYMLQESRNTILLIRYGVVAPFTLFILGLTYLGSFKKYMYALLICCIVVGVLGILSMIAITNEHEAAFFHYYTGLLIALIWIYSVVRINRIHASFISALIFVGYFLVAVGVQKMHVNHLNILINNLFFMATVIIAGSISAATMEKFIALFYKKHAALKHKRISLNEYKIKFSKREIKRNRFLSIISNDLRTPISSTKQILQLYSRGLITDKQLHSIVDKTIDSLDGSAILIDNILSWSRLDDERDIAKSRISLFKLADETIKLYSAAASLRGNSLECDIPSEYCIEGNETMMGLVFRNLISSSIKSTENDRIRIKASQNGKITEILISHRGNKISKVFDKELLEWEKSNAGNGLDTSGINFIISKEFVESHGGILSGYTNAQNEIIYYVLLPACSDKETSHNHTPVPDIEEEVGVLSYV